MYKKVIKKLSKLNKNQVLIGVAVLAVVITGVLISNKDLSSNVLSYLKFNSYMSDDAIAKNAVDYLNTSVLQEGQTATLDSVSKESGLVKIKLRIGANTYDSYATRDGKLLFPEAFKITASAGTPVAANPTTPSNTAAVTPATVAKVDKPVLEAYVVSMCPFGLQAQGAMAEAVKNIPSLTEYIKVRYIGSVSGDGKTITAMHGPEEAKRNLDQICLREEQNSKYWPYVACQRKSKDAAEECLSSTGVDIAKLNSCALDPARGVAYAKKDFDLADGLGVQGSPTFVLNGQEISETPFGGRSAYAIGNIICSSSTTQPDFCKTTLNALNKTPAATSFSLTYAPANSGGAVAASNANACAPAVQ